MDTSSSKQDVTENRHGGKSRLFVHTDNEIVQAVAVPEETLSDALKVAGIAITEDTAVFMGRVAFRSDPDETGDEDPSVSLGVALREITSSAGHAHVVLHRCHQIATSVHCQNRTIDRRLSPARTVGDVRAWAIRRLHLQDEAATDKLVLEICDSDRRPRPEVRIGTLTGADCGLCLDLVPDKIIEG
jgi:hypothetical protein